MEKKKKKVAKTRARARPGARANQEIRSFARMTLKEAGSYEARSLSQKPGRQRVCGWEGETPFIKENSAALSVTSASAKQ